MKNKKYLNNFIWFFILIISCDKKLHNEVAYSTIKSFQFTEIGRKEISEIVFPESWDIRSYSDSEAPPLTKEAVFFEQKLNDLDYFESTKGRLVTSKFYDNILFKKNQKIDSLFILDSISNKDVSFVYIKSYKTVNGDYDFPPKIREIDLLIFSKLKFKEKVNIYSYRDYPFAIGMRLGYLSAKGDLYLKDFEVDEEKTAFVHEEHLKISTNGNIKTISETNKFKLKNQVEIPNNSINLINWKGTYEITTRGISQYDNKEINLLYTITMESNKLGILSIGADQVQDYWCEGNYIFAIENNILHGKGKCEQDDMDDFYLKSENEKFYIKSKRFLNQDWQELTKD